MTDSMYARIGGEAAVDGAVGVFYEKILADGRVSGFFDAADMEAQPARRKSFPAMALGGPRLAFDRFGRGGDGLDRSCRRLSSIPCPSRPRRWEFLARQTLNLFLGDCGPFLR